jgi:hypothetical protein
MLNPINSNIPVVTTSVTTGNLTPTDNLAQDNALQENPASIVELSAEAQTLLQSANAAQAEATQTELIQAEVAQNEAAQTALDNAQALQQNFEQLAAQAAQNEATLTQNLAQAQLSALDSTEATVVTQALQSALSDAALNEAINTTAAAAAATTATSTATPLVSLNTSNVVTTTPTAPVTSGTTTSAADTAAAEAVTIAEESTLAEQALIATVAVETTPITDPSIAAAIAAYRVNDTILSEGDPLEEQAPPEAELDIEATTEIQESKVDLHDSARDEPIHGAAWNWQRINPIQRKSSTG